MPNSSIPPRPTREYCVILYRTVLHNNMIVEDETKEEESGPEENLDIKTSSNYPSKDTFHHLKEC